MMQQRTTLTKTLLSDLQEKSKLLTEKEKETYGVTLISNAIAKVTELAADDTAFTAFAGLTDALIAQFPVKNEQGKTVDRAYLKALTDYKSKLEKQYKLVTNGHYIGIFLPLGISIGLPFGLLFKNLALGIPIGLAIGVSIGAALDQKAKKENRLI